MGPGRSALLRKAAGASLTTVMDAGTVADHARRTPRPRAPSRAPFARVPPVSEPATRARLRGRRPALGDHAARGDAGGAPRLRLRPGDALPVALGAPRSAGARRASSTSATGPCARRASCAASRSGSAPSTRCSTSPSPTSAPGSRPARRRWRRCSSRSPSSAPRAPGGARWVEKTPRHLEVPELIAGTWPGARIVRIVRDPRDAAVSLTRVPFGTPSLLTNLSVLARMNEAGAAFFRTSPQALTLRYEDLVAEPERELRRLCAFVGEDYDPAMIDDREESGRVAAEHEWWKGDATGPTRPLPHRTVADARCPPAVQRYAALNLGDIIDEHGYGEAAAPRRTVAIVPAGDALTARYDDVLLRLSDAGRRRRTSRPGRRPTELVAREPARVLRGRRTARPGPGPAGGRARRRARRARARPARAAAPGSTGALGAPPDARPAPSARCGRARRGAHPAGADEAAPRRPTCRASWASMTDGSGVDERGTLPTVRAATDDAPIFVVGVARSGTTLLAALLSGHPRLDCRARVALLRAPAATSTPRPGRASSSRREWPGPAVGFVELAREPGPSGRRALRPHRRRHPGLARAAAAVDRGDARVARRVQHAERRGKARWVEKTPRHLLEIAAIRAAGRRRASCASCATRATSRSRSRGCRSRAGPSSSNLVRIDADDRASRDRLRARPTRADAALRGPRDGARARAAPRLRDDRRGLRAGDARSEQPPRRRGRRRARVVEGGRGRPARRLARGSLATRDARCRATLRRRPPGRLPARARLRGRPHAPRARRPSCRSAAAVGAGNDAILARARASLPSRSSARRRSSVAALDAADEVVFVGVRGQLDPFRGLRGRPHARRSRRLGALLVRRRLRRSPVRLARRADEPGAAAAVRPAELAALALLRLLARRSSRPQRAARRAHPR